VSIAEAGCCSRAEVVRAEVGRERATGRRDGAGRL